MSWTCTGDSEGGRGGAQGELCGEQCPSHGSSAGHWNLVVGVAGDRSSKALNARGKGLEFILRQGGSGMTVQSCASRGCTASNFKMYWGEGKRYEVETAVTG